MDFRRHTEARYGRTWFDGPQVRRSIVLDVHYAAIGVCGERDILRYMSRIIRSAMLQMRVSPEIKLATEHVLQRIGLNVTEATELFFRRMIIDQRIPFDVAAIDNATYTSLLLDWEDETRVIRMKRGKRSTKTPRTKKSTKKE